MSTRPERTLGALSFNLSLIVFVVLALLGWYVLYLSADTMVRMEGSETLLWWMMLMMRPVDTSAYLLATFAMWALMMVAMMIPAAMPMVSVYSGMNRQDASGALAPSALMCGYLMAWIAFSAVAAFVQWTLHSANLLHGMLLTIDERWAGAILIGAGIYQLTPLKDACLAHCRTPFGFFMQHWRPGTRGAFAMGLHHGFFCVGCCWVLMLLMFVGGAMSVATMLALTLFIVAERLLPPGPWVTRIPGFALIGWGAVLVWYAA